MVRFYNYNNIILLFFKYICIVFFVLVTFDNDKIIHDNNDKSDDRYKRIKKDILCKC